MKANIKKRAITAFQFILCIGVTYGSCAGLYSCSMYLFYPSTAALLSTARRIGNMCGLMAFQTLLQLAGRFLAARGVSRGFLLISKIGRLLYAGGFFLIIIMFMGFDDPWIEYLGVVLTFGCSILPIIFIPLYPNGGKHGRIKKSVDDIGHETNDI